MFASKRHQRVLYWHDFDSGDDAFLFRRLFQLNLVETFCRDDAPGFCRWVYKQARAQHWEERQKVRDMLLADEKDRARAARYINGADDLVMPMFATAPQFWTRLQDYAACIAAN